MTIKFYLITLIASICLIQVNESIAMLALRQPEEKNTELSELDRIFNSKETDNTIRSVLDIPENDTIGKNNNNKKLFFKKLLEGAQPKETSVATPTPENKTIKKTSSNGIAYSIFRYAYVALRQGEIPFQYKTATKGQDLFNDKESDVDEVTLKIGKEDPKISLLEFIWKDYRLTQTRPQKKLKIKPRNPLFPPYLVQQK